MSPKTAPKAPAKPTKPATKPGPKAPTKPVKPAPKPTPKPVPEAPPESPPPEDGERQPATVVAKDMDGVVRSLVVGEVAMVSHRKLGQIVMRVVSLRGNQLHGTYARDYNGGVTVDTKFCRFRLPTPEEAMDFHA